MRFDFTDFLYAMSFALDAVEHVFTGATAEHGKRVAWLSMKMLEGTGLSEEELMDSVGCAILLENATDEQEFDKLMMSFFSKKRVNQMCEHTLSLLSRKHKKIFSQIMEAYNQKQYALINHNHLANYRYAVPIRAIFSHVSKSRKPT